jgi:hypothetical protein
MEGKLQMYQELLEPLLFSPNYKQKQSMIKQGSSRVTDVKKVAFRNEPF